MWLLFVPFCSSWWSSLRSVIALTAGCAAMLGAAGRGCSSAWACGCSGIGDGRHRRAERRRCRRGRWHAPAVERHGHRPTRRRRRQTSGTPRPLRKPELPIDVQVKVEQIRRKVDVLLGYADAVPAVLAGPVPGHARPPATTCRGRSRRIWRMPQQAAEQPDRSPDGKTPHQELQGAARSARRQTGRHRPGPAAPGHRSPAGEPQVPRRALRPCVATARRRNALRVTPCSHPHSA